jgi:hypothetical protein
LTIVASFLIVSLGGVFYTNWVNDQAEQRYQELLRRSEQQWCTIIGTLDQAYQINPPTTPLGQRLATQMHLLYGNFGCVSVGDPSR